MFFKTFLEVGQMAKNVMQEMGVYDGCRGFVTPDVLVCGLSREATHLCGSLRGVDRVERREADQHTRQGFRHIQASGNIIR